MQRLRGYLEEALTPVELGEGRMEGYQVLSSVVVPEAMWQ